MKLLLLALGLHLYASSSLASRVAPAQAPLSAESAAAFIYDPVQGTSTANPDSIELTPGSLFEIQPPDFMPKKGLTLQCYIKPLSVDVTPIFSLGHLIQLSTLRVAGSQVWAGGQLSGKAVQVGHYSSTARLNPKQPHWIHLAAVYDPDALTVTYWVDHHLCTSIPLAQPLQLPANEKLQLGSKSAHLLVDEPHFTNAVLTPADFIRARADSIQDVHFHSTEQILPRQSGAYDAKYHFGAAGDGKTDDTAALNAAFDHLADKVPLAYNTLLLPAGTYLVKGMLYCSRFIDIRGAGTEKTIIRLQDHTFTDTSQPQPVLRMSSTRGHPGSHKGVNGSSISLYLSGITINTGIGNPGAKGLEYHSNNLGKLSDTIIRSGDGSGTVGLDCTHHDTGPCFIKNVQVQGFDYGVRTRYQEYSLTFEGLHLSSQKTAGIRNEGNIINIRHLYYEGTGPAIQSIGYNSMLTLIDSELKSQNSSQPAIEAEGAFYALRVTTAGFSQAVKKKVLTGQKPTTFTETIVPGPDLEEWVGDSITSHSGKAKEALKLPIEEVPAPQPTPLNQWQSVVSFKHLLKADDWSPALQAALDSDSQVIYLPRGECYTCKTPLYLKRAKRIYGMRNSIQWHPSIWKDIEKREQTDSAHAPPPLLIINTSEGSSPVFLERLFCDHLLHQGSGPLVLLSSTPERYSNAANCGKLWMEDLAGADWHFDHPQDTWAWQWNPESHRAGPCVSKNGGRLWSLGFKTEYESQKLLAQAGAKVEILGAFIYPIGKIPPDRPIFEAHNSQLSLIYGTSVYSSNHKLHIREMRDTEVRELGNDKLRWAGSRGRMDLYVSD